MASRSPVSPSRQFVLPDLPADLFGDDELYREFPPRRRQSSRPGNGPNRTGRSRRPALQSQAIAAPTQDLVTSLTMRPEPPSILQRSRARVLTLAPPVLPAPIQMLEQGVPNVLMAVSAALVLLLGSNTPLGIPIWAAGIFIPTVILALVSTTSKRAPWRRTALINVATMAMIFPVLVIRQSVVRIPFVGEGNGTLMAPAIATAAVIGLLLVLAVACAVLSQEDPEHAGIVFLPAAMMVPLLAGQSDLVSLTSALYLAVGIFAVSSILTIVASILPGGFPAIIVPATIGLEFVLLTAFQNTSIFPTGASGAAKVLFFAIVVATVALAILVPMMSVWVRQVTRLAQSRTHA